MNRWLRRAVAIIVAFGLTASPSRAEDLSVSLALGTPQQVLGIGELDMWDAPDMHLAPFQEPDGSYRVYITGRLEDPNVRHASTGLLSTTDFLFYAPVVGSPTHVRAVLSPSCDDRTPACLDNFDADYAGANAVFPAANGTDLLMIYHGATRHFGTTHNPEYPAYDEIGLARSSDGGLSWTRQGAIISGTDPKPTANPTSQINGAVEPGAIVAGDFFYVFYAYFPTAGDPDAGPPRIQVARSPVSGDGEPGTWTKYADGSFGSEPGFGGRGSAIVSVVPGCAAQRQPWVAWSAYLSAYVMTLVCPDGWYLSTSDDLVHWTSPIQFFAAPTPLFTTGQETDENLILVTPGNPGGVIGQTGYVLYASTPAWRRVQHTLWMRPFTFGLGG